MRKVSGPYSSDPDRPAIRTCPNLNLTHTRPLHTIRCYTGGTSARKRQVVKCKLPPLKSTARVRGESPSAATTHSNQCSEQNAYQPEVTAGPWACDGSPAAVGLLLTQHSKQSREHWRWIAHWDLAVKHRHRQWCPMCGEERGDAKHGETAVLELGSELPGFLRRRFAAEV